MKGEKNHGITIYRIRLDYPGCRDNQNHPQQQVKENQIMKTYAIDQVMNAVITLRAIERADHTTQAGRVTLQTVMEGFNSRETAIQFALEVLDAERLPVLKLPGGKRNDQMSNRRRLVAGAINRAYDSYSDRVSFSTKGAVASFTLTEKPTGNSDTVTRFIEDHNLAADEAATIRAIVAQAAARQAIAEAQAKDKAVEAAKQLAAASKAKFEDKIITILAARELADNKTNRALIIEQLAMAAIG
jgi:hypothetical protein